MTCTQAVVNEVRGTSPDGQTLILLQTEPFHFYRFRPKLAVCQEMLLSCPKRVIELPIWKCVGGTIAVFERRFLRVRSINRASASLPNSSFISHTTLARHPLRPSLRVYRSAFRGQPSTRNPSAV